MNNEKVAVKSKEVETLHFQEKMALDFSKISKSTARYLSEPHSGLGEVLTVGCKFLYYSESTATVWHSDFTFPHIFLTRSFNTKILYLIGARLMIGLLLNQQDPLSLPLEAN